MLLAKILSKAIFFAGGKMKKLKVFVAFLASAAMFFASCASDSGGNDSVNQKLNLELLENCQNSCLIVRNL